MALIWWLDTSLPCSSNLVLLLFGFLILGALVLLVGGPRQQKEATKTKSEKPKRKKQKTVHKCTDQLQEMLMMGCLLMDLADFSECPMDWALEDMLRSVKRSIDNTRRHLERERSRLKEQQWPKTHDSISASHTEEYTLPGCGCKKAKPSTSRSLSSGSLGSTSSLSIIPNFSEGSSSRLCQLPTFSEGKIWCNSLPGSSQKSEKSNSFQKFTDSSSAISESSFINSIFESSNVCTSSESSLTSDVESEFVFEKKPPLSENIPIQLSPLARWKLEGHTAGKVSSLQMQNVPLVVRKSWAELNGPGPSQETTEQEKAETQASIAKIHPNVASGLNVAETTISQSLIPDTQLPPRDEPQISGSRPLAAPTGIGQIQGETPFLPKHANDMLELSMEQQKTQVTDTELITSLPYHRKNKLKVTPSALLQIMDSMGMIPNSQAEGTECVGLSPRPQNPILESMEIHKTMSMKRSEGLTPSHHQRRESPERTPESQSQDTESMTSQKALQQITQSAVMTMASFLQGQNYMEVKTMPQLTTEDSERVLSVDRATGAMPHAQLISPAECRQLPLQNERSEELDPTQSVPSVSETWRQGVQSTQVTPGPQFQSVKPAELAPAPKWQGKQSAHLTPSSPLHGMEDINVTLAPEFQNIKTVESVQWIPMPAFQGAKSQELSPGQQSPGVKPAQLKALLQLRDVKSSELNAQCQAVDGQSRGTPEVSSPPPLVKPVEQKPELHCTKAKSSGLTQESKLQDEKYTELSSGPQWQSSKVPELSLKPQLQKGDNLETPESMPPGLKTEKVNHGPELGSMKYTQWIPGPEYQPKKCLVFNSGSQCQSVKPIDLKPVLHTRDGAPASKLRGEKYREVSSGPQWQSMKISDLPQGPELRSMKTSQGTPGPQFQSGKHTVIPTGTKPTGVTSAELNPELQWKDVTSSQLTPGSKVKDQKDTEFSSEPRWERIKISESSLGPLLHKEANLEMRSKSKSPDVKTVQSNQKPKLESMKCAQWIPGPEFRHRKPIMLNTSSQSQGVKVTTDLKPLSHTRDVKLSELQGEKQREVSSGLQWQSTKISDLSQEPQVQNGNLPSRSKAPALKSVQLNQETELQSMKTCRWIPGPEFQHRTAGFLTTHSHPRGDKRVDVNPELQIPPTRPTDLTSVSKFCDTKSIAFKPGIQRKDFKSSELSPEPSLKEGKPSDSSLGIQLQEFPSSPKSQDKKSDLTLNMKLPGVKSVEFGPGPQLQTEKSDWTPEWRVRDLKAELKRVPLCCTPPDVARETKPQVATSAEFIPGPKRQDKKPSELTLDTEVSLKPLRLNSPSQSQDSKPSVLTQETQPCGVKSLELSPQTELQSAESSEVVNCKTVTATHGNQASEFQSVKSSALVSESKFHSAIPSEFNAGKGCQGEKSPNVSPGACQGIGSPKLCTETKFPGDNSLKFKYEPKLLGGKPPTLDSVPPLECINYMVFNTGPPVQAIKSLVLNPGPERQGIKSSVSCLGPHKRCANWSEYIPEPKHQRVNSADYNPKAYLQDGNYKSQCTKFNPGPQGQGMAPSEIEHQEEPEGPKWVPFSPGPHWQDLNSSDLVPGETFPEVHSLEKHLGSQQQAVSSVLRLSPQSCDANPVVCSSEPLFHDGQSLEMNKEPLFCCANSVKFISGSELQNVKSEVPVAQSCCKTVKFVELNPGSFPTGGNSEKPPSDLREHGVKSMISASESSFRDATSPELKSRPQIPDMTSKSMYCFQHNSVTCSPDAPSVMTDLSPQPLLAESLDLTSCLKSQCVKSEPRFQDVQPVGLTLASQPQGRNCHQFTLGGSSAVLVPEPTKERSKRQMEELDNSLQWEYSLPRLSQHPSRKWRLPSKISQGASGAQRGLTQSILGRRKNIWENHVWKGRLPRKYLANMVMLGDTLESTRKKRPCSQLSPAGRATGDNCQSIQKLFGVPAELMTFPLNLLKKGQGAISDPSVVRSYIQRHTSCHGRDKRKPLQLWTRASISSILQQYCGTRGGIKKTNAKQEIAEQMSGSYAGDRIPASVESESSFRKFLTGKAVLAEEESGYSESDSEMIIFEPKYSSKPSSEAHSKFSGHSQLQDLTFQIAAKLLRSQVPPHVPPPRESGLVLQYPICLQCGLCSGLNCCHTSQAASGSYLLIYPQLHLAGSPDSHGELQLHLGFKLRTKKRPHATKSHGRDRPIITRSLMPPSQKKATIDTCASKRPTLVDLRSGSLKSTAQIETHIAQRWHGSSNPLESGKFRRYKRARVNPPPESSSESSDDGKQAMVRPKRTPPRRKTTPKLRVQSSGNVIQSSSKEFTQFKNDRIRAPQTASLHIIPKKSAQPTLMKLFCQGLKQALQRVHKTVAASGQKSEMEKPNKIRWSQNAHVKQKTGGHCYSDRTYHSHSERSHHGPSVVSSCSYTTKTHSCHHSERSHHGPSVVSSCSYSTKTHSCHHSEGSHHGPSVVSSCSYTTKTHSCRHSERIHSSSSARIQNHPLRRMKPGSTEEHPGHNSSIDFTGYSKTNSLRNRLNVETRP